ncbi:MAG: acyl carrier protein [Alphaproteobacteria bacterium]|nr:acyl carrier protein [Alphaproteobacteria bacterium]MBL0717751.1 acyl carrier protein [Alphaproteobacteria bacterium]
MTNNIEEISNKVINIIADKLSVEKTKIKMNSTIMEDLGADSLDTVELVMALEEECKISVSDTEAQELKTVQNIVDFVAKKTAS